MNAKEKYDLWLEKLDQGDPLYQELLSIRDDEKDIYERFYQEIVFGTAGLRGICGAGTNRMNALTVGRATQGIANYILGSGVDITKGLAIAYDCRYFSKEFSELVAEIMAGNGIRAYLFPEMRPTPELSFAIRRLGCISGVNMTASHNPKEYNGYKVYWSDGAQISGDVSDGMLSEIQKLDFFDEFRRMPLDEAREKGLVVMIGEDMDRAYLDYVKSMQQHPDEELDRTVSIVYTPLNGAGSIPVRTVLTEMGYTNFHIVPEQEMPDPEFTTVGYPNPEDPKGFELSEKLGKQVKAEVLIATDPDSDRMAIEVPGDDGEYHFLNGNQTGAMLIAYMAEGMKESGKLPEKAALIKSIVTGDMGAAIAESYGIKVFQALTGFKNICGKIHDAQAQGYDYFFGYEESIGCAPGEEVRDKDGVCCAMLVAEMTAYYRKKGMSLTDALEALYKKYGYFSEDQVSLVRTGAEGAALIGRIMDAFREGKPQSFGDFKVQKTTDYINGYEDIPASNVLRFDLGDGTWFAMRPSGTEPKIKFYYYAVADNKEESAGRVEDMKKAVDLLIREVK
ncbi:MAG: phospho-sugar mutase [Oscillospiraceae bacterium]|nr:phospho-sugar mutase [Oscillospiraceae bacterium]